jgi:20S proteasome alpha/beta subunit
MSEREQTAMHAKFLIATTLIAGSAFGQGSKELLRSHGTINIVLANRNGLVALTDSRLSSRGRQVSRGQKLFKVDDHTVCAVAGFYMDSGVPLKRADGQTMYPTYTSISNILRSYFRANTSPIDPNRLASALSQSLSFVTTIDKIAGTTPDQPEESQITLAGYRGGTLYIAQIFLLPKVVGGRIEYQAYPQKEKQVEGGLIFATGGLDQIARSSLNDPKQAVSTNPLDGRPLKAHDTMMEKLELAKSKDDGANLSIEDLIELARDLEVKTARAYPNMVGDDIEMAVLSDDHLQTFQQPVDESIEPSRLPYTVTSGVTASGVSFGTSGSTFLLMQYSSMAYVPIPLDGGLFLGDSFTNCHLIYRGTEDVFFDPSNVVVNSELDIGPSVRDDDPVVNRLETLYPQLQIRRMSDQP